jgi:hypothetical protein
MLAQDPYTGSFHEVPYPQVPALGQVLYDGLGNPVAGLFDTVRSLVSNIPFVGGLVSNLLPGGAPAAAPLPAAPAATVVVPPAPYVQPAQPPYAQPMPFGPQGPLGVLAPSLMQGGGYPPAGWTTPTLPYTGAPPRRLYLRCSVWPGQPGLVPMNPGQWPSQAQAGATGAIMALRRARRSRYRRRR